ncbi:MAG: Stp1/IreP family PP2C-type Ser/Thr phosphatase [Clostridia bacterium]|nr:Stp1/IreP family PP2C-type Ser/Thr phosphatase [Clostridia bacterium]
MNIFGRTDTGRVRPNNQDAFVCGQLSDTVRFAVVCDGMGGANGGNVASALAVRVISGRLVEGFRPGMEDSSLLNLLEATMAAANIEIYDAAQNDAALQGMGTTAVVAVADDAHAVITHAGDSRAYLYTGGVLQQLTRDDSIVQEMVDKGQLTEEEARSHPRKNFITKALGVTDDIQAGYLIQPLRKGDGLLLCTDGLTNMLGAQDIQEILTDNQPDYVPDKLIAAANRNGGGDNITVVYLTNNGQEA